MKLMVFVIDGLHDSNLSDVYVKWNEMYLMSRKVIFKESDLQEFQVTFNYMHILYFSTL